MHNKSFSMIFAAMGIVLNLVLGTMVSMAKIPFLFLDTIGTIFVAATLGPVYGMLTGGLTNVIQGFLTNPKDIPFALVNIAIGLLVGLAAKKGGFGFKKSIIVGIILSIIAPLIGTPIAVWIYGGLTGGGQDIIFAWLLKSGQSIFTATFIPRILSNLIDKIGSCILVAFLITRIPYDMKKKLGIG